MPSRLSSRSITWLLLRRRRAGGRGRPAAPGHGERRAAAVADLGHGDRERQRAQVRVGHRVLADRRELALQPGRSGYRAMLVPDEEDVARAPALRSSRSAMCVY